MAEDIITYVLEPAIIGFFIPSTVDIIRDLCLN